MNTSASPSTSTSTSSILESARADVDALPLSLALTLSPAASAPPAHWAMVRALLVVQRAVTRASGMPALEDALREVGRRLEEQLDREPRPAALLTSWGEPDLLPLVDRLAGALSSAARARDDERTALLTACLRDELSPACVALGWFALDVAVPFETAFDPSVHKAIERVVDEAHAGLIVDLVRVGRRSPRGALTEPSHVVVAGGA